MRVTPRPLSTWACRAARDQVRRGLWVARALKELHFAAVCVQRRFREIKNRRHACALKVQTQWRRYAHRNDVRNLRRAKLSLEALVWCARRRRRVCARSSPRCFGAQRKRKQRDLVLSSYRVTRTLRRNIVLWFCTTKARARGAQQRTRKRAGGGGRRC